MVTRGWKREESLLRTREWSDHVTALTTRGDSHHRRPVSESLQFVSTGTFQFVVLPIRTALVITPSPGGRSRRDYGVLGVVFGLLGEGSEVLSYLISHGAKQGKLLVVRAMKGRGILETLVHCHRRASKHRTGFARVVTDSENVVELLVSEVVHVLGSVLA